MRSSVKFALVYIRNGDTTIFPVENIEQAIRLADAIANSDLLNDSVDYNVFDVVEYSYGKIGNAWESEDGLDFSEYWSEILRNENEDSV